MAQSVLDLILRSRKTGDGEKQTTSGLESLGGSFKGLLATFGLAVGAGAAVRAAISFGKESIKAASDVEEMSSKFGTVFKDLAGGTEAELSALADTINRSKFDLMGYAATFQDTFVPLGFARDKAADMSVALVGLAEDLASFNNLNTGDVVRDLQSAMVGNTETLRKYGVVANDSTIKAKAMEMGLWDGTGAMDAQTKAAAILEITIDGTADAQGDAARTADSLANQQKGLEAAVLDLKVALGEGLAPAAKEATSALTVLAQRVTEPTSAWAALMIAVDEGRMGMVEANLEMLKMAVTSKTGADVIRDLEDAVEKSTMRVEGATSAHEDWRLAMKSSEQAARDAAAAAQMEKERLEDLELQLDAVKVAINGPVAEALGGFKTSLKDLQTEHSNLISRQQELITDGITPADAAFIELELKLRANEQAQIDLESATQETIKAFIFQQATAGLSAEATLALAREFGFLDEQSYNAALQINQWKQDLDDGKITVDEYTALVSGLAGAMDRIVSKDVTIHITTFEERIQQINTPTGDTRYQDVELRAAGGPVERGVPYLVGERGPELFVPRERGQIMPNEQVSTAGTTYQLTYIGNSYESQSSLIDQIRMLEALEAMKR